MSHPTKRSLLGEILKLYHYGFVPERRLYRFCLDLAKTGFKSSFFNHTINCCIWRHNTSKVREWNERYWYWYEEYELFHGCQITSAIAEWEVYGKKLPRVPMQVDLKQSTRVKTYGESYSMTTIPDYIHEDGFKKRVARILDLDIEKEAPFLYTDSIDVNDQLIVFTCITNAYDEFPEDSFYEEDVRYVCFHDGTIDTSIGPWEYIQLDLDIEDPRDFAYYVKAHPQEYFPKDSHTVWIDACFKLTKEFTENSRKSFPFCVLRHGGKFTYLDEVLEGFTCAFFGESDVINLSNELRESKYNFKKYSSPQCTILWRKLTDDVIKFNEEWYKWGSRGYNRDNIPFDAAIQLTGITPEFYDDRNKSGIELGYVNKIGRKGKHPQHGDKKQYLNQGQFLRRIGSITGLHSKIYSRYKEHSFYMRVYNII